MGTKYSTNSASGYNATPPSDDGTVSEANKIKWSTAKTKLADPIKDLADTINSELVTHFNNGPVAITSNTTLAATHYNQVIQVSGSGVTLTLTDAATLAAGWYCDIISTDATNSITLARATASDMINEVSSNVTILPLQELRVVVNAAANGFLVNLKPRFGKVFNLNQSVNHAAETDVASASTTNIGAAASNNVRITGTTTITAFDTVAAGICRWGRFAGALTFTHHATSLILPNNGSNITTAAGDSFFAESLGSGNWKVHFYQRANGAALVGTFASSTEVKTGTEAAKSIAPDALLAAIGFSAKYNSGNQTITSAGALTLAHGLGREPILVICWLKCLSAEFNFSVGDKINMMLTPAQSAADNQNATFRSDSTNITIRFGSNATVMTCHNWTTGAGVALTNSSWALVVEAFA